MIKMSKNINRIDKNKEMSPCVFCHASPKCNRLNKQRMAIIETSVNKNPVSMLTWWPFDMLIGLTCVGGGFI